ncbi:NAD-dependent epimerase [Stenotrophomonas maltophilia]|uniref:NAD-dependent epimerase n=1 Tax=Stenotrophomonas maltophilia TaxID=40324 RepID=UPI0006AC12FE|nr:NAD-dependent epimerase [Stenotrophomonas maltophilia]KOQ69368.1 capsular biosynthesis protein CpsI [Stenotrophomonas maltophilia]MBH1664344.1 NAD-dependent epimerase [Stenotrophomonas maltophilia]OBU51502.1 capsular biosynthesis protein CpsI [Stenotrophomonas maltophilia]HEL5052740.1 NAD-dependent epimerase [Stenotrophomonas maltophilia]
MKILVTGAAGFIGFHSSMRLLDSGHEIVGIDNLNDYYDVRLKEARLAQLDGRHAFSFIRLDLSDREGMATLFNDHCFDVVLHLGAQAGVRYSIDNPFAYVDSNLTGTLTVLEGCRRHGVKHLVYASSSSVYGANTKQPFSTEDRVDAPISLYAATKRADELMCQTYAHLYRFPITGLRFFTVYGPWGRPDMAYFKFANAITSGSSIDVYNHGDMKRDFTYIDDIVDGIQTLVEGAPLPADDETPHRVYNLGNNNPEQLLEMISLLEAALGRQARKNLLPMQPGDVLATYADIRHSTQDFSFVPKTDLATGLKRFAAWYRQFYPERTS